MATTTANKTKSTRNTKSTRSTTRSTRSTTTTTKAEAKSGVAVARERLVQATETAVDVPVGAALTVVERVNDAVEPFGTPSKREAELKRFRTQLRRELNKVERRGGTARRRALQRAKRTRNRLEREVKQQRRGLETSVRQNRRKAETQLKQAEKQLKANRTEAEKTVRGLVDRFGGSRTAS
jgi:prefoldin subunit 5